MTSSFHTYILHNNISLVLRYELAEMTKTPNAPENENQQCLLKLEVKRQTHVCPEQFKAHLCTIKPEHGPCTLCLQQNKRNFSFGCAAYLF